METYVMIKTALGDDSLCRSVTFEWYKGFKDDRQLRRFVKVLKIVNLIINFIKTLSQVTIHGFMDTIWNKVLVILVTRTQKLFTR